MARMSVMDPRGEGKEFDLDDDANSEILG